MGSVASFAKQACGIVTLKGYEFVEYLDVAMKMRTLFENADYGEYALMVHDMDFNGEGVAESPHIHFYCECLTRKRVSTIIHELSKYCDVNRLAVTCSPCSSEVATLQYFTHQKEPPEKHRYDRSLMITNIPKETLDIMLDSESGDGVSASSLRALVAECHGSVCIIMERLGMKAYMKYRYPIIDLLKELYGPHWKRYEKSSNVEKSAA